jgi:predicted HAD superfamily phosphohydrolase
MATRELTGAHERADHMVDTTTAPLSPDAVELMARVEAHFPLIHAVTQYETAAVHAVQLAALAEVGKMTDLDADSLAHAEDLMAGARAVLADAGRLDLIGGA